MDSDFSFSYNKKIIYIFIDYLYDSYNSKNILQSINKLGTYNQRLEFIHPKIIIDIINEKNYNVNIFMEILQLTLTYLDIGKTYYINNDDKEKINLYNFITKMDEYIHNEEKIKTEKKKLEVLENISKHLEDLKFASGIGSEYFKAKEHFDKSK